MCQYQSILTQQLFFLHSVYRYRSGPTKWTSTRRGTPSELYLCPSTRLVSSVTTLTFGLYAANSYQNATQSVSIYHHLQKQKVHPESFRNWEEGSRHHKTTSFESYQRATRRGRKWVYAPYRYSGTASVGKRLL